MLKRFKYNLLVYWVNQSNERRQKKFVLISFFSPSPHIIKWPLSLSLIFSFYCYLKILLFLCFNLVPIFPLRFFVFLFSTTFLCLSPQSLLCSSFPLPLSYPLWSDALLLRCIQTLWCIWAKQQTALLYTMRLRQRGDFVLLLLCVTFWNLMWKNAHICSQGACFNEFC